MLETPAKCNPQTITDHTLVPFAVTPIMAQACAPETSLQQTLYIHTTPYKPATWLVAPSLSNLLSYFPNLVHDLTYRSPIGNPPPLSKSFLPPNLSSENIHPGLIDQELCTEVVASHMSGPFTIMQAATSLMAPSILHLLVL